ncbi:dystonin [Biomphalaria pfeifferi]|uniref:Dystonin n=1 Tax=Biomphalaria pfeifferi TaxID=112525 RepID=A0AAD8BVF9_BIOPF|nr:dystonin [Biomphalaria pfeifferi]
MLARKTTKQIKRKKTTVRKSEKSLNILDKKVERMKSNSASFDNFISKIQEWMRIKAGTAKQMFELIDREGEGLLTYDQFKAGMFDMRVPANKVELHLLCRLLDTNDNCKIDYKRLENLLQSVRQIRDSELEQFNEHQLLLATSQKTLPCPCCPMLRVEPTKDLESRCILLELRAIAFDMVNNHPGHFKILVHSKLPVCGLVQTIISQTGISSTKLAIFYDKTRFAESVLSPNMTLEECGFIGDFKGCPEEVTLFYDYTVEFSECPILMSDFYFE